MAERYAKLPDQTGPPCAPLQRAVEEIKVIHFDISGIDNADRDRRARDYEEVIVKRLRRAGRLAPVSYCDKPVTPRFNPENPKAPKKLADPVEPRRRRNPANRNNQRRNRNHGERNARVPPDDARPTALDPSSGHSYHAVQMTDSSCEDGSDPHVQLLVRDYDQYVPGFRVEKHGVWSTWYHCTDLLLPAHFGAVNMGITGEHGIATKIGGDKCVRDMFYGLANYPERQWDKVQLRRSFLRAVVMFSEAIRLRLVFEYVLRALMLNSKPSLLTKRMWNQINSWGNLSEFVLVVAKKNHGRLFQNATYRNFLSKGTITSFEMLVVTANSDLMLLMRKELVLLPNGIPKRLKAPGAGLLVTDSEFDA